MDSANPLECLISYDLGPVRVMPLTGDRWLLEGKYGTWEARIAGEASARWRCFVGDWAASRGFRSIQRFLMNLYHERMVPLGDGLVLYVTDAFSDRASAWPVTAADEAAALLAQLHAAMDGAGAVWVERLDTADTGPLDSRLPARWVRYGTWSTAVRQAGARFAAERLLMARDAAVDSDWLAWLERWEALCQRIEARLRGLGYGELAQEAKERLEVAWDGFGLNTCRTATDTGRWGVLQMADPVFDLATSDLVALCQEVSAAGYSEGVPAAIARYRAARETVGWSIPVEEAESVQVLAALPRMALRWVEGARGGRLDRLPQDWREQAAAQAAAAEHLLG